MISNRTALAHPNAFQAPSPGLPAHGDPVPRAVMSPPGARPRAVMPRVGLTRGQPARRDARGEPHPPLTLGYFTDYTDVGVL